MHTWRGTTLACSLIALLPLAANAADLFGDALLFHAGFDKSPAAERAGGDAKIYTAPSLKRESVRAGLPSEGVVWSREHGRNGGALHFTKKQDELVFFQGKKNVPDAKSNFRGTVSLWLRLTPSEDLPAGYVDPLQITDKKWNDASFFVDFDHAKSREFRLGVFSDYSFWNPRDRNFESIPPQERPMVFVRKPPFQRDKWTHVAFTWDKFNTGEVARATLSIDGKAVGSVDGKQQFTWNVDDVVIMLGINYVGWLDDLMIFDRPLQPAEIQQLFAGKSSSK